MDLDYWDSCLKSLLYAIARATLQKAIDSLSHIDDIGLSADSSASNCYSED